MNRTARYAFLTLLGAVATLVSLKNTQAQLTAISIRGPEAARPALELGRRGDVSPTSQLKLLLGCLGLLSSGDTDGAIKQCSIVLSNDPESATAYKLRGRAYVIENRYVSALMDLNRAIALDASDAETFATRGVLYRKQGLSERAIADFGEAIRLRPSEPAFWNSRCWTRAIAAVRLPNALADCNEALRLRPLFAAAFDSRGLVYLRLHRYGLSANDYVRSLQLDENVATAHFGHGLALCGLGQLRLARREVARAQEIDPDITDTFAQMGLHLPAGLGRPPRNNVHSNPPQYPLTRSAANTVL